MIVATCIFRTAVSTQDGVTRRVCTGEDVGFNLHEDDCAVESGNLPAGQCLIYSLRDVRKAVRGVLALDAIFSMLAFVALCCALWKQFIDCVLAEHWVFSLNTVAACALAICFMFLTQQFFRPIVHDCGGHWINLKTGSSNLCGGIVIRKD